jgi:phosphatidylglycerophosphatase C
LSVQVLYDFDGTITSKDTTKFLLLELLKLRPWLFSGLIWFLFRMIFTSNIVSKQRYKNQAIGYLIKGLSDIQLSVALQSFKNKVGNFYRPIVLKSIDQAILNGSTVLIVTASPSFAIRVCVSDLSVEVIGTEFEKEEDRYTGHLKGENCYGQEKVNRLNKWASTNNIELSVKAAWGDHFSDYNMLCLSEDRYWIGGEYLRKMVKEHDPKAKFVQTEY